VKLNQHRTDYSNGDRVKPESVISPERLEMEHVIRQTLEQGVRDNARWLDEAVNGATPLSAEMRLRVLLAEDAINKAAEAEVAARPYVPASDRLHRIIPEYGEDIRALMPEWKKKYTKSPFGQRAEVWSKHADTLERHREVGRLVYQRTMWSDELQPPELTPEQAAVLAKYVDRGVPAFKEYLDPERASEPVEADERKRAGTWAADAFHEIMTGEEPKWHPHRVK
jgi:hypothetical protein